MPSPLLLGLGRGVGLRSRNPGSKKVARRRAAWLRLVRQERRAKKRAYAKASALLSRVVEELPDGEQKAELVALLRRKMRPYEQVLRRERELRLLRAAVSEIRSSRTDKDPASSWRGAVGRLSELVSELGAPCEA